MLEATGRVLVDGRSGVLATAEGGTGLAVAGRVLVQERSGVLAAAAGATGLAVTARASSWTMGAVC